MKTHGLSRHPLYRRWSLMHLRCENENSPGYRNYGGRGISVCDEWKDFSKFYIWATKSGFKECLQIDRIDVNGNYEPCNCRWVTAKVNCNNLRKNLRYEFGGQSLTISEISDIIGIPYKTIANRIFTKKWPADQWFRPATAANGSDHNCAKLKEEDISKIRALRQDGHTFLAIAKMFSVSKSSIIRVHSGKCWKRIACVLLFAGLLPSCGPSRDANGQMWRAKQVWRRVTAGNSNPIINQVKCPQKP